MIRGFGLGALSALVCSGVCWLLWHFDLVTDPQIHFGLVFMTFWTAWFIGAFGHNQTARIFADDFDLPEGP